MIDKEYGKYIIACDVCTNEMDATFETFQGAVDGRGSEGYEALMINGQLVDVCPECQEVN
jgi:hypothetical protein